MSKISLAIILLTTVALTLIVPAVSGIFSLQEVGAATSGKNGKNGIIIYPQCKGRSYLSMCLADGGYGGFGNVGNEGMSFNGNGGDGGSIIRCFPVTIGSCVVLGGFGEHPNELVQRDNVNVEQREVGWIE